MEKKLLIVDDDAMSRYLAPDIFPAPEYTIYIADGLKEAMTILRKDPEIAVVVSDLKMEDSSDGLQLLAQMRKNGHTQRFILDTSFPDIPDGSRDLYEELRSEIFAAHFLAISEEEVRQSVIRAFETLEAPQARKLAIPA
ncbi:MAG: response regulator [Alphaproteobacteria bacterium]|nr:response regulator [Alphaproteobacteria bacterium]